MQSVVKKVAAVASALTLLASAAGAQPAGLVFNGTTGLCFYLTAGPACSPTLGAGSTIAGSGLTYTAGTFSTTTDVNGFAGIGGTGNNLGTLSLTYPPAFNYNPYSFALLVDITAPPTLPGAFNFTGILTGNVIADGNGVSLVFNGPLSQNFNFDYQSGPLQGFSGTGSFSVPSFVSVNANNPAQAISAQIRATGSIVPEPSTYLLLGSGLLGLAGFAHRRRSTV